MEFFFNKTLSTLFHFLTRKIGNFNFHSPYSYFVFYSNVGYLSHYLTKTYSDCYQFQRTPKISHYSSEIYCYFCMPISRLMNFFSSVTFCFLKKNVPLGTHKKRTKQDTFLFFLLICFCSFFFICMYYISLFVFALSCCDTRGSFLSFPFSYNFVYRISGIPYLKFWGQPM